MHSTIQITLLGFQQVGTFENKFSRFSGQVQLKEYDRYIVSSINTSYLTESYIIFTLKIESVPKIKIFGLQMMVKSGLEKIFLKFFHAH